MMESEVGNETHNSQDVLLDAKRKAVCAAYVKMLRRT